MLTLKEILTKETGDQVKELQGKITKVWKPKTGDNEGGEWKLQGLVITDGTTELNLTFKNRKEVPRSMEGSEMRITAPVDDKGKSKGMKMDFFNNKKLVLVDDRAKAILMGVENAAASEHHAQPGAAGKPAPAGSNGMTKDDWWTKDRLDIRTRVINTAVAHLFPALIAAGVTDNQAWGRTEEMAERAVAFVFKGQAVQQAEPATEVLAGAKAADSAAAEPEKKDPPKEKTKEQLAQEEELRKQDEACNDFEF